MKFKLPFVLPDEPENNSRLHYMKFQRHLNREKIRTFLEGNFCASRKEIAKATGLSAGTISGHLKAIRAEMKRRESNNPRMGSSTAFGPEEE